MAKREPTTQTEVEQAAKAWIQNLVAWKRRYVEGLQNEIWSLRERLAKANGRIRYLEAQLAAKDSEIRTLELSQEMACIEPDPTCSCSGCSYARKIQGDS